MAEIAGDLCSPDTPSTDNIMKQRLRIEPRRIDRMVRKLARRIIRSWGHPTILLPVLSGAWLFGADLIRCLNDFGCDPELEGLQAYRDAQGVPHVKHVPDVGNKDVLVVDTIYDTGNTIAEVCRGLTAPRSLAFAFLLARGPKAPYLGAPTFIGLQLGSNPDYMIGYGLDRNGKQRGCRSIYSETPSKEVPHSRLIRKLDPNES